jgi:hypothetical protein
MLDFPSMPPRPKHALLAAVILTAALVIASSALGASSLVTLHIKREYTHRHTTACHKTKAWRLFHRNASLEYTGLVIPAPSAAFPVRLEIKRCIAGTWGGKTNREITGQASTGEYKGFLNTGPLAPTSHRARAITFYKARAIINGSERSRYEYFAVTN